MRKNLLFLCALLMFGIYNGFAQNVAMQTEYLLSKVIEKNHYTGDMDTTYFTYNNKNQLIKCATPQAVYDNFMYNATGQLASFKRSDESHGNKKIAIKLAYSNNRLKTECPTGEYVNEEYVLLNNKISKGSGTAWFSEENISYNYNEDGNITTATLNTDYNKDTALYTFDKNYLNPYNTIGSHLWMLLSSSAENVILSESKNVATTGIKIRNHLSMEEVWERTENMLFKATIAEAAEENKVLPKVVKYIYDDGTENVVSFFYTKRK